MKLSLYALSLLWVISTSSLFSQEENPKNWYTPLQSLSKLEGQGWEHIGYQRLPDTAKTVVRDAVWSLSKQAAGMGIRFETEADSIAIMYEVDGNLAMPHMPATGVSGVDLYVKKERDWLWCHGKYTFKDTVRYDFVVNRLPTVKRTYFLFFPLYNNIKNLKIGIHQKNSFRFLSPKKEKPIVVYGTSIAQGACASRPGMAWTNILSRKLDRSIVNLGFSGNGRLEPEVIGLLNEIEASVFVLDCLPNLMPIRGFDRAEIQKRIRESVRSIRGKHPKTPILLVQHAGYADGLVDSERHDAYEALNLWMTEVFQDLRKEGTENLFMLTKNQLGLSNDAFVDGTHPTDLGMVQYATAYEKILAQILLAKD